MASNFSFLKASTCKESSVFRVRSSSSGLRSDKQWHLCSMCSKLHLSKQIGSLRRPPVLLQRRDVESDFLFIWNNLSNNGIKYFETWRALQHVEQAQKLLMKVKAGAPLITWHLFVAPWFELAILCLRWKTCAAIPGTGGIWEHTVILIEGGPWSSFHRRDRQRLVLTPEEQVWVESKSADAMLKINIKSCPIVDLHLHEISGLTQLLHPQSLWIQSWT